MKATEIAKVVKKQVTQDISLADCMSRSGYPWGSKQELKLLEPHANKDTHRMHSIRLENLNVKTLPETLNTVFRIYGELGVVYCPRPLHVTLRTTDANQGFAFIRFKDKRDLEVALADVKAGKLIVDGQVLTGDYLVPSFWPTDKTRRYF